MKSFLQGKTSLSIPALNRQHTAPLRASVASTRPPAADEGHSPNIEAVKEGDKVVRLIITCGCGERMEVDCIYPAGS